MTEADFSFYPLLKDEVRGLEAFSGSGRPFLRLSRPKDALFVTDLPRHASPERLARFRAQAQGLGWQVTGEGAALMLSPTAPLLSRLPLPPRCDCVCPGEAGAFLRLMDRYARPGPPDEAFCLVLLRSSGRARLGGRPADLLWDIRRAYALGLRRHDAVRTPLTCALMREICTVLERKDPRA